MIGGHIGGSGAAGDLYHQQDIDHQTGQRGPQGSQRDGFAGILQVPRQPHSGRHAGKSGEHNGKDAKEAIGIVHLTKKPQGVVCG